MFTVYKITGEVSPLVYIGYCEGDNPLKSFSIGANRPDADRKDVAFLDLQGDRVAAIVLLQVETEYEAFVERNRLRGNIAESFTAPSAWPQSMWSRMDSTSKETLSKQIADWNKWQLPTARAAYEEKLWDMKDLEGARQKHGRQCIIDALLKLSPLEFHLQYVAPFR